MAIHNEIEFENDICEHLAEDGWLYAEKDAVEYDRKLALFLADVIASVQETQPDAWETLVKNHGSAATENGHSPSYHRGDTEFDRDVDITDFNFLAANFAPDGYGASAMLLALLGLTLLAGARVQ